jgi:2-polyprenyl-3-methyl-5-hydroxy-6-metoxy-1,4-benzoquinol methylase
MTEPANSTLPFTGERFTPECVREMWLEHWHRYAFALAWARGRRVLDAACGEGYGAALLAREGAQVTAVDVSAEALEHARTRYGEIPGLSFVEADVADLAQMPDASFDLIVSFETLEHLEAQDAMLAGFRRLLAPGGLLLISTPDRRVYSDQTGYRNEFHVRELYRDEFDALLGRHFGAHRLLGQKLLFLSVLHDISRNPCRASARTMAADGTSAVDGLDYASVYYLAVAAHSAEDLPPALDGHVDLFGDAAESVYRHYEHEIRKNMAAGGVIQDLERRIQRLRERLIAAGLDPDAP